METIVSKQPSVVYSYTEDDKTIKKVISVAVKDVYLAKRISNVILQALKIGVILECI